MFGDSFEVEHVMHLLREYAACAKRHLSPKEKKSLRGNSVLVVVEQKLHDALLAMPLRPVTNRREAYENALESVRSAPNPADWTETKLNEFERQLLAVHAIDGDLARHAADATTKNLRKGGLGGTDVATLLLRDMCLAYQRRLGKWPTARKLVDAMKASKHITEDESGKNLRLRDDNGRTAIIANDMTIIGNRIRNFKNARGRS